jgi:hypothetical protein
MTDPLLDTLANDLKPVRPMRLLPLWLIAGAGLVVAALFVIFVYGPRPEMAALGHGVWPSAFMIIGKPLVFVITGLSALWSLGALIRPQGRLKPLTLAPVALLVVLIVLMAIAQYIGDGPAKTLHSLQGGNTLCFATIAGGGAIGFGLLWVVWLRKSATTAPVTLGALSGLAAASLAAAAYAIHCNMDAPAYLLLVYGVAVGLITALAALAGSRLFKW